MTMSLNPSNNATTPAHKCGDCAFYHKPECPAEDADDLQYKRYFKHYNEPPYQDNPCCFKANAKEGRESQADYLVSIGLEAELFKDDEGEPYAAIPVSKHTEIWPLRSLHFKRWLVGRYYSETQKAPNTDAINQSLGVLESKATFESATRQLWLRVAEYEGAFWYDLGDPEWRAVRITPVGWEVIENPPVLFKRYKNSAPQVQPELGGDLRDLLKLINIDGSEEPEPDNWGMLSDDDILQMVYIVVVLVPEIPKPIQMIYGSKGAIKSTGQEIMKQSIDPTLEPLLTLRKDEKELAIQLAHNYFPVFDNISDLSDSQNDMLCRAATGAGFSSRQLYTDEEERIFKFTRPIGLNGIHLIAGGTDLQDRFLAIERKRVPEDKRREKREILDKFKVLRPKLFGAVLTALSRAMAVKPTINQPRLPRMADFTIWGCAVAEALGIGEDRFLKAYYNNINYVNDRVLESYPLAAAILSFMADRKEWSGTPKDLLEQLEVIAEGMRISLKDDWPKNTTWLSRRVNELSSNLADSGIEVTFDREKKRSIRLQKGMTNSVLSVDSDAYDKNDDKGSSTNGATNADTKKIAAPIASMVVDDKNDGNRHYDTIDAILHPPLEVQPVAADPPLSTNVEVKEFCDNCGRASGSDPETVLCHFDGFSKNRGFVCEHWQPKKSKDDPGSVEAQLREEGGS